LVSGALLAKKGINILSAGDTFTLFSGNTTVAGGVIHGDMYQLNVGIIRPPRDLQSRIGPAIAITNPDQASFGTA
jgi:hypothetical protein